MCFHNGNACFSGTRSRCRSTRSLRPKPCVRRLIFQLVVRSMALCGQPLPPLYLNVVAGTALLPRGCFEAAGEHQPDR